MSPERRTYKVSSKQGNQRQELVQDRALFGTEFNLAILSSSQDTSEYSFSNDVAIYFIILSVPKMEWNFFFLLKITGL